MNTDELLKKLNEIRHQSDAAKTRVAGQQCHSLAHYYDGVGDGIQRAINEINWQVRVAKMEAAKCTLSES